MKKCSRCGILKDFKFFQLRRASKDGLTASCKDCLSLYDKSRSKQPHRVIARYDYSKTERGREARKRARDKYEANNEQKINQSKQDWDERNPKKKKVHGITAFAIRSGFLKRMPCEICGEKKSHAHHDDYDKPLDVRWLCSMHHQEWHAENGEGINGH